MKIALAAALCIAFDTCRAYGAVIALSGFMDAPRARPPNLGVGVAYAAATVDDVTGAFSISGTSKTVLPLAGVSLRGPNNPPTDVSGPLILDMAFSSSQPSVGAAFDGVFSGTAVFDASQVSELLAGHDFVAVYTALPDNAPAPALGGSLVVPEPSLFGVICPWGLVGVWRRQSSERRFLK
jgi:hypothetical protein